MRWFFSILTHINSSKSKFYLVKIFEKTSIKFHVPSLSKWQKVLLTFRNIGRSITDENFFHFLSSKHFFSRNCSFRKFQPCFFLLLISCWNFAVRNKLERSCEINVLNSAGVWPTYLFVAGSIILLQCLSMIHKTGANLRKWWDMKITPFGTDTYVWWSGWQEHLA